MNIEWQLLNHVAFGERIPLSEIARRLGISKSYLSEIIGRLEARGAVRRVKVGGVTYVEIGEKAVWIGIVRASEYAYLTSMVKALEERGLTPITRVYEGPLQVLHDLVGGKLALAALPAPTAVLGLLLKDELVALDVGFSGGSYIIRNPTPLEEGRGKAATTKFSSMEYCISRVSELRNADIVYVNSGDEALRLLAKGKVEYAALWEPYARFALRMGLRPYTNCKEVGLEVCCVLVINPQRLDADYVSAMLKGLDKDNALKRLGLYSYITGIDEDVLAETVKSYDVVWGVADYLARVSGEFVVLPSTRRIRIMRL